MERQHHQGTWKGQVGMPFGQREGVGLGVWQPGLEQDKAKLTYQSPLFQGWSVRSQWENNGQRGSIWWGGKQTGTPTIPP